MRVRIRTFRLWARTLRGGSCCSLERSTAGENCPGRTDGTGSSGATRYPAFQHIRHAFHSPSRSTSSDSKRVGECWDERDTKAVPAKVKETTASTHALHEFASLLALCAHWKHPRLFCTLQERRKGRVCSDRLRIPSEQPFHLKPT